MTELTVKEINARLSALVVAMMAKGVTIPDAECQFNANVRARVWLWARGGHKPFNGSCVKNFTNDDVAFALDTADKFVSSLPDLKIIKLTAHMNRVADCIDKGRADGIDDEYIAPLAAVKQAMSENLLTSQVQP
jgi:hypothetical protein